MASLGKCLGSRLCGALLSLCLLVWAPAATAQTVDLFQGFVGNLNFETTGGSLRLAPNTSNSCSVGTSSTNPLNNIPATATITAAYLYWAGSGSTVDSTVTLNGTTVTADETFFQTFVAFNTNFDFFSGRADVTALITGNGNYTFSGLTVNSGAPHCASSAVLAGWGLVVVYSDPAEDLRAVNIFDGFQFFRGNAITVTPNNYRVPTSPINGKVSVITWEGDPQNSGALNGFNEGLTFNGATLDDGLVPPASNPVLQQFDGTINGLGLQNTHGVDIDTYDVSAFISPGDTSATTVYSSGGDLVLLSAEIISTTTEPMVDLSISKTHSGDFTVGVDGVYTIQVTNNGPEGEANPVQVTDTLPNGLTFISGTGTNWTCSAAGQDVTCDHPGPIPVGNTLPDLTLTVGVGAAAAPSVDNVATISSASLDTTPGNDTVTDTTTVLASDLSTSSKTVVDLNGGDANPGDTLRYTINLIETAGADALNVSVTDDIPGNVTSFSVVSVPGGATDNSTGLGTGANGTGFLDVSDITVAANTTVSLVFDVVVAGTANPGDIISNVANVTNGNGIGASPSAPNVIVSQSSIPSNGTKPLYLYDLGTTDPNGFNQGPQPYLSRTPPAAPQSNVTVDKNLAPRTWTLTPAISQDLTLSAPSIPVTLWVSKGGATGGSPQRTVTVSLSSIGTTSGPIGTPVTQTFAAPPSVNPLSVLFNIPLPSNITLSAGSQIVLTVTNITPGGGSRRVRVFPIGTTDNSRIDLNALTVINVDSVNSFDALFPGGAQLANFAPGDDVFVRTVISDPFGSFDINPLTQPTLDIVDSAGTTVVSAQSLTQVADSGAANRTFEFQYTIPAAGPNGTWTMRVTGYEGTEGTVTHTGIGTFDVNTPAPDLVIAKTVQVVSDPINNTTNPKSIPGAFELYSITVTNQGLGGVDANTLVITDPLPDIVSLFVDTGGGDPIVMVDGSTPSGLTPLNYGADVTFSNQVGGGPPFNYTPTPDVNGVDGSVTGVRINPQGAMAPAVGGNTPSFTIRLQVRVN